MNYFVKVRTGGEYLDILRDDIQVGDIFAGNVFSGFENKIIDPDKIKIYRGGETQTVSAEDYQKIIGEKEIEYTYTKHEIVEEIDGTIRLKTESELLEEKNIKIQQELLTQFKPLIDAMTFQEISKSKGSKSGNAIFTDDDIKNWGNYISEIANGNLESVMPTIPEKYKKIVGK